MKTTIKNKLFKMLFASVFISSFTFYACSGDSQPKDYSVKATEQTEEVTKEEAVTEEVDRVAVSAERLEAGKQVYVSVCQACHMENGKGIAGVFPPLSNSDYLLADLNRAIHIIANGMKGEIVVNGVTYNQEMPKPLPELSNQQVADVLTFVLNSWDNKGGVITPEEVSVARK
jgi:nitrite reductase (NO-forming)